MQLLLPLLVLAVSQSTQDARAAERDFIYYDYVEDGVLKGGTVSIDPENPLLADPGGVQYASASTFVTLVDNGRPENRIDLVFVGDGYTAAELGDYADDVDGILPTIFAEPPLAAYAPFFNVHRVDVISNESGVDNDPTQGISRDTALDMAYWCSGIERLLCVNVGQAFAEANMAPDRDQVLAVANSSKYGGAGYNDLGTLSGSNGAAIEVALHEFGHSFANLADEYTYGGSETYTGSEPSSQNLSIRDETAMAAEMVKWYRWLDEPNVSTFEGGGYSELGIYRPTNNSKMRSLYRPFEQVNTERFIRAIYAVVDPIDDATQPGTKPLTRTFFVDPLAPVSHALDIQWSLDGVPIPGATGEIFDASSLGLSGGPYTLSVEVVDNTTLVRNETIRSSLMTSERSWILLDSDHLEPFAGPVHDGGSLILFGGDPVPGATLVLGVPVPAALPAPMIGPLLVLSTKRHTPYDGRLSLALGPYLIGILRGPTPVNRRPVPIAVELPDDASLVGLEFHAQALWKAADGRGSFLASRPMSLTLER